MGQHPQGTESFSFFQFICTNSTEDSNTKHTVAQASTNSSHTGWGRDLYYDLNGCLDILGAWTLAFVQLSLRPLEIWAGVHVLSLECWLLLMEDMTWHTWRSELHLLWLVQVLKTLACIILAWIFLRLFLWCPPPKKNACLKSGMIVHAFSYQHVGGRGR